MAAPVLEEFSDVVYSSSANSLDLDYDSFTAINSGDLLLAVGWARASIDTDEYDASPTPTDFTFEQAIGDSSGDVHIGLYSKIATGSESGTVAIGNNNAVQVRAVMARISGVSADPVNVISTYESTASATTHNITGLTTTNAEELVLSFIGIDLSNAVTLESTNSWVEELNNNTTDRPAVCVASKEMATAGATGDAEITLAFSNGAAGITVSILPAAGGGGGANARGPLAGQGGLAGHGGIAGPGGGLAGNVTAMVKQAQFNKAMQTGDHLQRVKLAA